MRTFSMFVGLLACAAPILGVLIAVHGGTAADRTLASAVSTDRMNW